jgi:signal transduction histidine kinase
MNSYNLVTSIQTCFAFRESISLGFVYYSHIPSIIISLLFGFFVYFKGKSLVAKALLCMSLVFSIWSTLDLITWQYGYNSILTMFSWSLLGIFYALFFFFSLYFIYVFIYKREPGFISKIILGLMFLPIVLMTPTRFNLDYFDNVNCEPVEGSIFISYYYFFGVVAFLWMAVLLIRSFRKADKKEREQLLLLSLGISLCLLAFSWGNIVGGLVQNWQITQYGLFGMPVFLGFLAYLIVRYKAFNIKMLATNALVAALVILIGSEYFFTDNPTNIILIGVTLILALGFGYLLIKSVKLEVQRKEELQTMSDKLAMANDQLRKLDNAKSEFISIASHQLRTPLTAIKGFISLLLEGSYGKVSAKHRDVLNKIYLSNERLIALVEDLLNLSRIESGRMEYNYEKVKLEDVCQEVFDTFIIRAKDHKLDFKLKMPEKLLSQVMTDRGKIREVISNLVDNALKYTPKGGVTISLAEADGFVRVSIKDTGIGIPQEELPYLFAKFSRGKDVGRLNAVGTGLGLHVGKSMVEAMGGRILAESEGAGKGSTFIVEVPVEHKEEA